MEAFSVQWFDDRAALRAAFLAGQGLAEAKLDHVAEDGAFRRYWRLPWRGKSALLMETVPASSGIATPGHRLDDFVRIGAWLRDNGLHAPAVYALDEQNGYALLEDFGDVTFRAALAGGVAADNIYGLATDVLIRLRSLDASSLQLGDYFAGTAHQNRRRIVDWYLPALRGRRNEDGLAEDYLRVWDGIERTLPPCPRGFLHVDYHLENLMWRNGRRGTDACGILDYQMAVIGPLPYDLLNLLEDARRDVPDDIRTAMLDRYCAGMDAPTRETFMLWYKVLTAQFHCRVMGQFVRLAVHGGKMRYLAHLPRVAAYLRRELADPLLAPLWEWFTGQDVGFDAVRDIDLDRVRSLIRADAV